MQFCTPLQTSLLLHTVYEIKCIMDQTPPYRSLPLVVHQGSHHAWKETMHVSIYQLCADVHRLDPQTLIGTCACTTICISPAETSFPIGSCWYALDHCSPSWPQPSLSCTVLLPPGPHRWRSVLNTGQNQDPPRPSLYGKFYRGSRRWFRLAAKYTHNGTLDILGTTRKCPD